MKVQNHPFFEYFEKKIADELVDAVEIRTTGYNTILFREGDPSDGIYLVLKGLVGLTKGKKEQEFIASVGEGGFFGEFGVLDGKARSARATSFGDIELAFIPRSILLKKVASREDSAALRMAIQIVGKVRESNKHHVEELLRRERLSLLGRMVAAMTHDFRNPFAIINMAIGVIRSDSNESIVEYTQLIEDQIARVTAMTEDVLDFTRNEVSLNVESLDISVLLDRFKRQNEAFLSTQNIHLQVETEPCIIQADSEKMMRVFQNLVYNAVDAYNGAEGNIQIRQKCSDENTGVYVTIQDYGPGIPPEMQTNLFEPFATQGKKKGLGLGMAIAHHFIEVHGGSISFTTSEKGTLFHIYLPNAEPSSNESE